MRNRLIISTEEAAGRIDRHIERGEALRTEAEALHDADARSQWANALKRWQDVGKAALATTFEATDEADEFYGASTRGISRQFGQSEEETFAYRLEALDAGLNTLHSLKERLEFAASVSPELVAGQQPSGSIETRNKVFVVHGRNTLARDAIFDFLRAVGVHPIDWSEAIRLTGKGAPYVGEVLDAAFAEAQAVVVLMTPDEIACLRIEYAFEPDEPDVRPSGQARPNVLFEAGMALGRDSDRTIMVQLGELREFSDIAGRHTIRVTSGGRFREDIAARLETAGCTVDLTGDDWRSAGDFAVPPPMIPNQAHLGAEVPHPSRDEAVRVQAHHNRRDKGGVLTLTNAGTVDLQDLRFELPEEAGSSFHLFAELPIVNFPAGANIGFPTARTMGPGADHFELLITARTPDGQQVSTKAFVNLVT